VDVIETHPLEPVSTPAPLPSAGRRRRLAAGLADALLCLGMLVAVEAILMPARWVGLGSVLGYIVLTAPAAAFWVALVAAYAWAGEAPPRDASFGKLLLGLAIVDQTGGPAAAPLAQRRLILKGLAAPLLVAALATLLAIPFPTDAPRSLAAWLRPLIGVAIVALLAYGPMIAGRRALHDRWATTMVTRRAAEAGVGRGGGAARASAEASRTLVRLATAVLLLTALAATQYLAHSNPVALAQPWLLAWGPIAAATRREIWVAAAIVLGLRGVAVAFERSGRWRRAGGYALATGAIAAAAIGGLPARLVEAVILPTPSAVVLPRVTAAETSVAQTHFVDRAFVQPASPAVRLTLVSIEELRSGLLRVNLAYENVSGQPLIGALRCPGPAQGRVATDERAPIMLVAAGRTFPVIEDDCGPRPGQIHSLLPRQILRSSVLFAAPSQLPPTIEIRYGAWGELRIELGLGIAAHSRGAA
jgi:hypothetical protein